ncbi:Major Facilitator Superfamily protein [Roseivivax sp. THAF40]|uniref:MFS transporter n=1 Tax=unclassified Roseivivax TaxID=2639302 RepID=UPI001268B91C|nr:MULTISPECIES: MFS transporter [unclassified Roseivivax]QFS84383.1 Major Facilitator Superfamily protein [Roseivivax sp. THAF197b]QFT48211.1 Major Facilitator Superfamily protein [Roseivivax sp. THAF40]
MQRRHAITYFQTLSAAGFAATAISYGPARIGFGLFVPEFRAAFDLSSSAIGFISSLGFAGFFVGLVIAQALLMRRGPESPVLLGMVAATLGIALVAMATGVPMLALGVFIAASSAGFAWTPYNDAVHRKINDEDRPTVLSRISTGTSIGIVLSGAAALAMVLTGIDWRICWAAFAIASLGVLAINRRALHPIEKAPDRGDGKRWRELLTSAAMPMYAVAFIYGTTAAIYVSFAADWFTETGGVPGLPATAAPAMIFMILGAFGLSGFLTEDARKSLGLTWLLRVMMLTGAGSLAAVSLWAGSWAALAVSAALQGINVMMTSAVLAFWSERLFPTLPSMSFTAALLATAAGSIIGPALAGLAADAYGTPAMFLGAALLPLAGAVLLRTSLVRERPVTPFNAMPT